MSYCIRVYESLKFAVELEEWKEAATKIVGDHCMHLQNLTSDV